MKPVLLLWSGMRTTPSETPSVMWLPSHMELTFVDTAYLILPNLLCIFASRPNQASLPTVSVMASTSWWPFVTLWTRSILLLSTLPWPKAFLLVSSSRLTVFLVFSPPCLSSPHFNLFPVLFVPLPRFVSFICFLYTLLGCKRVRMLFYIITCRRVRGGEREALNGRVWGRGYSSKGTRDDIESGFIFLCVYWSVGPRLNRSSTVSSSYSASSGCLALSFNEAQNWWWRDVCEMQFG